MWSSSETRSFNVVTNGDGSSIDREEFQLYYDHTTAAMFTYHSACTCTSARAHVEEIATKADQEAAEDLMSVGQLHEP